MTTTETGRRAEEVAADFLRGKGCQVVAQNWRTRYCEIDIVATRGGIVYMCEVKYRRRTGHGRGLDYITPRKLTQMRFAAELWVAAHNWSGSYELCAIEVSGSGFHITAVVKGI